jgi:hypothetical protein
MASHEACCGTMFWVYLMSCVGLVMFAGLMSGLTLGLMSLSLVDLEVLAKAGTPKDKLNAGTPPPPPPPPRRGVAGAVAWLLLLLLLISSYRTDPHPVWILT